MNTPINKHPNYNEFIGNLIKLISDNLGCELQVYCAENINVVYAQIEDVVLNEYEIGIEDLFNKNNKYAASHPRYVIAYLLRKYTPLKDDEIARRLKRDRSTIIYGFNQIQLLLEKNDDAAIKINNCITKLKELSR